MNILMVTNNYTPFVGGVARSVESFSSAFRTKGHGVLVVAPRYDGTPEEEDVVRVPAIQKFNGSDFALPVPVPGLLSEALEDFGPEVVHSHHPYLLGDTALRISAGRGIPIVFTHHTMYERYTHYFPGRSPLYERFIKDIAAGYCNLCDTVVAPSESVASLLRERGVEVPIETVPTGVVLEDFPGGDGGSFRGEAGIPPEAFLVGHVGRLAEEKNLEFLSTAVADFLEGHGHAHFLVVGDGSARAGMERAFSSRGLASRVHFTGSLAKKALAAAYGSMNVFAFASTTETQGLVLVEAMAAGVPVVALDGPGVREVMRDGVNGRLLRGGGTGEFRDALSWVLTLEGGSKERLAAGLRETAEAFSMSRCADRMLALYRGIGGKPRRRRIDQSAWERTRRLIKEEWKILETHLRAAASTVQPPSGEEGS